MGLCSLCSPIACYEVLKMSSSYSSRSRYYKSEIDGQRLHPETQMMSYGYDPSLSEGALKPPVFHTSTFVFENAEDGELLGMLE